ncbi:MAG: 3-deoxy-D-manno-octulosonic acid transferase [Armatimonadetes bacterium]|nr:3-deoxy-D-manno-octulosonic acid transferase [Armatimonadota bacterium]
MTAQSRPDGSQRKGASLAWYVHNVLNVLALPLFGLYLLWRLLVRRKPLAQVGERLGAVADQLEPVRDCPDPVVWVHAVSAGEVVAVAPVIEQIRLAEPMARLVMTTNTTTGREMVATQHLDPDVLLRFPLDLPWVVKRVLELMSPDVIVLVETELWPNLLEEARRRDIPVVMVNARISDRSFKRARLLKPMFRWMLSNVTLVCAQSQFDADRFVTLGADPERVVVTGNSKFDEQFPAVNDADIAKYRRDFGFAVDEPVLLAASTHEGEEEIILEAFTRLRVNHPGLQLLIAPRHPERGGRVEELVHNYGYNAYRRSRALDAGGQDPLAPEGDHQICVAILDTMGELARVYAVGSITFVGNSLTSPGGGHNILQPIAQGKPVLFGPQMQNFRDITAICLREGVAFQVSGLDEMVEKADQLLSSEGDLALMSSRGRLLLERYAGASERNAERVLEILRERDSIPSGSTVTGG